MKARPETFLVVHLDDDPNDLRLFEEAINSTGVPIHVLQLLYPLKTIQWFDSAGAKYADLGNTVKLLLCDYNLGTVKAPVVIPSMKKFFSSDPLVIVFSGCEDEDAVTQSYASGAHCFLRKPGSLARLEEVVRRLRQAISTGTVGALTGLEEYAPPGAETLQACGRESR